SVFLSGDLSPVLLDWDLLAAAVAAGVATALGAALLPAVRAASDEPADAVRRAPDGPGGVYRRLHGLLCLTLVGSGVALILFRGALPPRFGSYFGLVLVLVGLLAAMPFLVGAFAELLRPVVRWLFGIEMRLAAENLTRSPGRTGLVIGAFGAG